MENTLKKHSFNRFGKINYLLGTDKDGIKYYLESPSWDCGWYWGFGYIETFTNNRNPERSRDIQSHSHADNFMSEYFIEWNGSEPILNKTTFTEKEGWELSELFERFYFLRNSAEVWGKGNCHITDSKVIMDKKPELVKEINDILIPKVTKRILEILSPENESEGN